MFLYLSAEVANVGALDFPNSVERPYEFSFSVRCTQCHEEGGNSVQINMFEAHEIPGSRGTANYVARCKFCQCRGTISLAVPKGYSGYTSGVTRMLEVECRGVEIVRFLCEQPLCAPGFPQVDLADGGEWYDYDETLGEEVSVTDAIWTIGN